MQAIDRTKYTVLQPPQIQLIVLYAVAMTTNIVAPPCVSRIGGGIRLVWFFTPWLLLGFVSIGLLLVLDVFPRMLLTYFCDCNRNDTPIDL